MLDLAIRGGTVVTADAVTAADVGIDGGQIVTVGSVGPARDEIDATGLLVLPGGVDPHTHLAAQQRPDGPRSPTDFATGARAAAFGGTTTIIDYALQRPGGTLSDAVTDWMTRARDSGIDYACHLVLADASPATLAEIPGLVERGYPTFKLFLHRFDDDGALAAMRAIAAAGGIAMLHCEDGAIEAAVYRKLGDGSPVPASAWPRLRPAASEDAGTTRAMALARDAACPVYVVHVSTATSLERILGARRDGVTASIEVRPIHLWFSAERYADPDAWVTFSGYPPLRERGDVERLWQAVVDGGVDTVGSDHAAWTREQKLAAEADSAALPVGMAGLETLRSAVFSAGVLDRGLPISRFAALTATTAARLLGLGASKGSIAPGIDADIVLWDQAAVRVIAADSGHAGVDLDPFDGVQLVGWPRQVLSRGVTVLLDGAFTGAIGRGRLVQRHLQ
jgi:dihydropyrimidinase